MRNHGQNKRPQQHRQHVDPHGNSRAGSIKDDAALRRLVDFGLGMHEIDRYEEGYEGVVLVREELQEGFGLKFEFEFDLERNVRTGGEIGDEEGHVSAAHVRLVTAEDHFLLVA